jgi:hypothetical protein
MKRVSCWIAAALLGTGLAFAQVTTPDLINYQGVLRDGSDDPLDGTYEMRFLFFSDDTAGDEIIIDEHLLGNGVTVTGGLFNVKLGGGSLADGSGPGLYRYLREVFRDYDEVWLEVRIKEPVGGGWETLTPRIQVLSAGYALNAEHLDGLDGGSFLRSDVPDIATGRITFAAIPAGAGPVAGSSAVNPPSASAGWTLFGVAVAGSERFRIDAEGNAIVQGHLMAYGDSGLGAVIGESPVGGGHFADSDGTGYATVGHNDRGITAYGSEAGGYFSETDSSAHALVASNGYGIEAYGGSFAGYFSSSGFGSEAYVGAAHRGIEGYGPNEGVYGVGDAAGGFFEDGDSSGRAYVAYGHVGIDARGDIAGGYFKDANGSGYANVGVGDWGIYAVGSAIGGRFDDANSASYGEVGVGSYKILGTGAVSFVQNHPEDAERVIVYAAPEGDEVAVYTRGTARLVDGEARVGLGQTFKWVANPDLGLTAHLTPHGDPVALAVESIETDELLVRGPEGSNAVFDYLVFGLRIGFEEQSIVQEKHHESLIPSMADHRDRYERYPELRRFNALERFEGMAAEARGTDSLDLARAEALRAAVGEYNPAVHGPVEGLRGFGIPREPTQARPRGERQNREADVTTPDSTAHPPAQPVKTAMQESSRNGPPPWTITRRVAGEVDTGSVLAADPLRPGVLRAAQGIADPHVVGVATGPPVEDLAPVAVATIVLCKVDAGYGPIRIGDLLTSSPTAGHAMTTLDPLPGTVLGKALEGLEVGTGVIEILVMPR